MARVVQSASLGAHRERLPSLARPEMSLARLRLALGGVVLLGVLLFTFGTSWDIQWHSFVGRDRALVPPHLMMLGGIVLCGLAALSDVAVETLWARANPAIASVSTPFAGTFYGSLGAYVSGFAALIAGAGFPLDVFWHALYGIDVSVWAPFHVQIITGMAIAALGDVYLLTSGASLARGAGATTLVRAARIGATIAVAAMLCTLYFYLNAAFDDAAIPLGTVSINTFPLMVGAFGGFALTLVASGWPARFAATGVALAYYILDALIFLAVPPLTDALVAVEHQSYRRGEHPTLVVVSWLMPLTLIVGAAAVDLAFGYARRHGLPTSATMRLVIVAAVIGLVLTVLLDPLYLGIDFFPALSDAGGGLLLAFAAPLLGALGVWGGSWLGLEVGASLQRIVR